MMILNHWTGEMFRTSRGSIVAACHRGNEQPSLFPDIKEKMPSGEERTAFESILVPVAERP
jgi:hypothetical protein